MDAARITNAEEGTLMKACKLCLVSAALALLLVSPAAAAVTVATDDGLSLTLNSDGSWNSLTVDGNPIPQTANPSGFRVEPFEGKNITYTREVYFPATPIVGTATQEGSNARITATADGLDWDILLTGGGPCIEVDGTVTNPYGTDRIFVVYFRIPVNANGWLWGEDIGSNQTLDARNWFFNEYVFQQARHKCLSANPFSSVTKTSDPKMGLSLSPLFDPPCAHAIMYYYQSGFSIEFELGTSAKTTKHPNSADFHFVLYKHDPAWGHRSAVKRYYDFFPAWFQKVSLDGNWMDEYWNFPTDPQDFAIQYYETDFWNTQWALDNGIYSCKYAEAWCQHIVWAESEMEQKALDIPENWGLAPYHKGIPTAEAAQTALMCTSTHPDQSYIGPDESLWEDPDWGEGVSWRWITNPDMEIPNWRNFTFQGEPSRTRGESVDYWLWHRAWGQDPQLPGDVNDGLYHDSVGNWWSGWTIVKNYCDEHWAYYDHSLIIDHARGLPAMCAAYSNVEHMKDAYNQMVLEDRVVMANTGHNFEGQTAYELFMCAPYLDMFGDESFSTGKDHHNRVFRAIAYQKPISYLNGAQTESAILELMPYGIYPGFAGGENWESYRPLYTTHMPILNEITAAGWEPVTKARPSNAVMILERFGPDQNGVVYLALRASSRGATNITISSEEMGWPTNPDVTVTELIYGNPVSTSYDGNGNLVISCGTVNRKDNRVYKLAPNFGPQPPVADFSGSPRSGAPPLTVYFTDLSTGAPTSWHWTFGDGGESYDQHPSHEYTSEDTYTVSLTAENAYGQDTETKVDYITVATGPAQSCHVGSIEMADGGVPSYKARATIVVHDQDCVPLPGVTVNITWSGCVAGSDSDVTDGNGQVVFTSGRNKQGGTFTCCVDGLTKDGYPYQSGDNHETCDSIQLP